MNVKKSRSDAFELTKQAIVDKKLISAIYQGKPRELCPHVLGWKGEREHALFFQIGGDSAKGLAAVGSWRCFNLDELSEVEIHDGEFRTGPGYYESRQKCVDRTEAQIPPLRVVSKRATV